MKKVIFGLIAAVVLISGSIFVIAQRSGDKTGHRFGPGGRGHHAGGIGMALRGLDLTDEQKAKVKEITEASRTTIQPLKEQAKANHEKIRSLGTNGTFDQVQVEAVAADQGSLTAKMIVEKERVKAQVFALLTDEQKAKAETMRTKMDEKFKARRSARDQKTEFDF